MIRNYFQAAALQHETSAYAPEGEDIDREERTVLYVAGRGDFKGTTINQVLFRFTETTRDDDTYNWIGDIEIVSMWDDEEQKIPHDSILEKIAKNDIIQSMDEWYANGGYDRYPSEDMSCLPQDPANMNNEKASEWYWKQRGAQE